jgi:hypothetical protein
MPVQLVHELWPNSQDGNGKTPAKKDTLNTQLPTNCWRHAHFDMTKAFQYFTGFAWIMPAIWLLSFLLLLDESGWDDTSEPLWLRISATIAFPPRCMFALIDHLHLPDHIVSMALLSALFVNSFLWAFVFVFLCRFVARSVRANRKA